MDKASVAVIGAGLVFLHGWYMAVMARVEVGRLRSRVTELEDKVRQLLATHDAALGRPEQEGPK